MFPQRRKDAKTEPPVFPEILLALRLCAFAGELSAKRIQATLV
jgi:hypothetical protein